MEAHTSSTESGQSRRRGFDPVVHGLLIAFVACLALIPLEIESLFSLPAHPLLLHFPVVVIPLLAIAAVALMIRSEWRRRYGVALAITALIALAATNLTVAAGEAFKEARETPASSLSAQVPPAPLAEGTEPGEASEDAALEEHAELGDQLRIAMIVFTGAIVLLVVADEVRRRRIGGRLGQGAELLERPRTALFMRAGIGALAVFALVWVIRTGHEGAKATWNSGSGAGAVGATAPSESGESGEGSEGVAPYVPAG